MYRNNEYDLSFIMGYVDSTEVCLVKCAPSQLWCETVLCLSEWSASGELGAHSADRLRRVVLIVMCGHVPFDKRVLLCCAQCSRTAALREQC